MKNKGFTLVEIVSTLVILALIGIVIGINLNKSFKTNETTEYNNFEKMIKSAADIYVTSSNKIKNDLDTVKGYYIITVKELQDAGLLGTDLINPKTKTALKGDEIVKVSIDANGVSVYEYQPEIPDESYLYARNIIASVEDKFSCESYIGEFGSKTFNLVAPNGDINTSINVNDVIVKVNCNFNSNIPGNYNIVYTYKVPETGVEKTFKRKITIYSDLLNTTALNADIKFDVSTMVFVMYDNNLNYTLTIKNNSNYSRSINVKDILIMDAISNGNLTINTTDNNLKKQANDYFSNIGLTFSLDANQQITYSFPLIVKAQAGSTLYYQALYTISSESTSQSSQTPKKEIDVEKNITIFEVNAVGVNVVMVLDVSGSMSSSKMTAMKIAANAFIDAQNLVSSKICIISFANNANLKGCSQNITTLKNYVNSLSASGGTYYKKALQEAQTAFNNQFTGFSNNNYLIFLSDGAPSDSDYTSVANNLKTNGITIYTIALAGSNTILKNMASSTSGYFSTTTGNLSEAFMNISTKINTGETINTIKGVATINSSIITTAPVEFTITAENGNITKLNYNNVNEAIAAGYIIKEGTIYKIVATKFKASDKITFSYRINL